MMPKPPVENVLVIGTSELAHSVSAEMSKRRRYRVLEFSEPGEPGRVFKDGVPFMGSLDAGLRSAPQIHRIVIAMNERRGRMPIDALLDARRRGIIVEDAVYAFERLSGKLALDRVQPSHLIFYGEPRRTRLHRVLQDILSAVLATVGLIVCAPLLAAIAILVKWDSLVPVLFVQQRIGKDGRLFPLMKFRTMNPAFERRTECARDNGYLITRVGRWLRKSRLDELPQLFNVLLGHMNLVGPRPHPACNHELFMQLIPFYAFRTTVKPGITGWAQVRYGYANNLEEEIEKMRYDLYYIKYQSLRLDLEIFLRTIAVMVLGKGAPAGRRHAGSDVEHGCPVGRGIAGK